MEAQFVRICSLTTMVTKVTDELLVAIFTISRMITVGHLYLFAKVAANVHGLCAGGKLVFLSALNRCQIYNKKLKFCTNDE